MTRESLLRACAPLIIAALAADMWDLIRDPVFWVTAGLLTVLDDRWSIAEKFWVRLRKD